MAWAALTPKPTICVIGGGMVRDIKRRGLRQVGDKAEAGIPTSISTQLAEDRSWTGPGQVLDRVDLERSFLCASQGPLLSKSG